ncbi:MAG: NAD(P)/FAD-dependent oxidoreductase [Promethearchaeota archaeon]
MLDKTEHVDICIIGGSIAGNYLCYLLSKKRNFKIAVIEEHDEIGVPFQCAGIISKKLSNLIQLPEKIILNRAKVARLVSPSGKYITLSGDEEPYIIDRIALDKLFYEKVSNKPGIIYYLGEKFKDFSYIVVNNQKSVLINTNKRKIISKMLIGCDGPLSSVGKVLGVNNKIIFASQIRVVGKFNQNEALMYFDPRWKELFGWIVPEGNNYYRIGIASLKNPLSKLKIFLKKINIDFNNKIDQQGGIIPYGVMNKISFDNILLLGDSACQVKATTGGGIIMLLTATKNAALCIIKCFKLGNFSKKKIKKFYIQPCLATIGKQLKVHFIIRTILENFNKKDFDTFFKILKINKIEHLISFYGDMDFPKQIIFQLLKNPTVIRFILIFFIKNPFMFPKLIKILLT